MILEYCVGGDLLGVLKQDVALPEASVARFAADLCESLRVVHAAGTLHCDLKPSNVLMDEDGRLKLCGFGLARKVADVSASRTNASNATPSALARRGTPCYMAPELFEEGGSHSFASDLYAFGCVLYELAAGKPPFVSASLAELMEMILTEDPPPIEREGGSSRRSATRSRTSSSRSSAKTRRGARRGRRFSRTRFGDPPPSPRTSPRASRRWRTQRRRSRQPAFEARARERARPRVPGATGESGADAGGRPNREKPRADAGALDADAAARLEDADSRATRSPATTRAALKPANGSSASRTHATSARSKEVTRLSPRGEGEPRAGGGAGYAERRRASCGLRPRCASPSPKRSADKARADKAGDVSLADADAELNFAGGGGRAERE